MVGVYLNEIVAIFWALLLNLLNCFWWRDPSIIGKSALCSLTRSLAILSFQSLSFSGKLFSLSLVYIHLVMFSFDILLLIFLLIFFLLNILLLVFSWRYSHFAELLASFRLIILIILFGDSLVHLSSSFSLFLTASNYGLVTPCRLLLRVVTWS